VITTVKASKAERNKGIAKRAAAKTSASALPAAALAKPDIKKIQGLLKSKTADGVTLGPSLLPRRRRQLTQRYLTGTLERVECLGSGGRASRELH
jgi:hypothetical protein